MSMMIPEVELRVLGSLIEKQSTTPEYYPMTLNAITNACNQKSNRDPMVQYEEKQVQQALDQLRQRGMAAVVTGAGIRTPKYKHYFKEKLELSDAQVAVLCELMLRGPQTVGELRTRAERMHPFLDLEEVDVVLNELLNRTPPLVLRLPRLAGQKEQRYMHLLSGEPDTEQWSQRPEKAEPVSAERMELLEQQLRTLQEELADLHKQFQEWKAQFE
jgi:uncharacterized protein